MIEERMVIGISHSNTVQAHVGRYLFANEFVKNKVVLDAACGSGYGSYMLSKTAKSVYGVDISNNALEMATKMYNANNITYKKADIRILPYPNNKFDVVVSFETIEHILQGPEFLRECHRVLKPGGLLIISTPNAAVSSPGGRIQNPYHLVEYLPDEFLNLLWIQFSNAKLYGQKPIVTFPILRRFLGKTPNYEVQPFKKRLRTYSYMVAICTKGGF